MRRLLIRDMKLPDVGLPLPYAGWNALKHLRREIREKQVEAQNGVCALCPEKIGYTDVKSDSYFRGDMDHDHSTGLVRGILCTTCNQNMAVIDRGDDWIKKAIEYRDSGGCMWYSIEERS